MQNGATTSVLSSRLGKRRRPERAGGRPAAGWGGWFQNAARVVAGASALAAVGGAVPAAAWAQPPGSRGALAGSSFGPPTALARPGNVAPPLRTFLPARQASLARPGNVAAPVLAPLPTRQAPLQPAPAAGFTRATPASATPAAPAVGTTANAGSSAPATGQLTGDDPRRRARAPSVVVYPFGTTYYADPGCAAAVGYVADPGAPAPIEEHGFTLPAPNPDYTAAVVPSYQPVPPPSTRGRSPQPRSEAVEPSEDDPAPAPSAQPAPGLLVQTAAPGAGLMSPVPGAAPDPNPPRRGARPAAAYHPPSRPPADPASVEDGGAGLPADPSTPVAPPDEFVRAVQRSLQVLSYYRGTVNGRYDEATSDALNRFQADHGLTAAGELDVTTLRALRILPD